MSGGQRERVSYAGGSSVVIVEFEFELLGG